MIPPWTSVAVITVQGDGWFSRMLTSPNDCFGPSLPTITNLILQPCNSQTLNTIYTTIADKKSSKIRIRMLWHSFSKYDCLSGYLLVNRFHQWSHILKDVTFSTSNEDHKWTDLSLLHQHCKYRFKNWISQETTDIPIKTATNNYFHILYVQYTAIQMFRVVNICKNVFERSEGEKRCKNINNLKYYYHVFGV